MTTIRKKPTTKITPKAKYIKNAITKIKVKPVTKTKGVPYSRRKNIA